MVSQIFPSACVFSYKTGCSESKNFEPQSVDYNKITINTHMGQHIIYWTLISQKKCLFFMIHLAISRTLIFLSVFAVASVL